MLPTVAAETIAMKAREATVPPLMEPAAVKSSKSTAMKTAGMKPTSMEATPAVTATVRSVGEA